MNVDKGREGVKKIPKCCGSWWKSYIWMPPNSERPCPSFTHPLSVCVSGDLSLSFSSLSLAYIRPLSPSPFSSKHTVPSSPPSFPPLDPLLSRGTCSTVVLLLPLLSRHVPVVCPRPPPLQEFPRALHARPHLHNDPVSLITKRANGNALTASLSY